MSDDRKSYLINAVIQLAQELGRTPLRKEAVHIHKAFSIYDIEKHFGTYSILLQAAGLEPERKHKDTITNQVFETNIDTHLENYHKDETVHSINQAPRILTPFTLASISDIHWPFSNEKVVKRFIEYVGDEKPEYVVLNGDAWDMYSHAKFPRSHNIFTPREEQDKARSMNEQFWKEVKRVHAEAKCYQMLGNHDVRPMKRILEAYPAAEDWIAKMLQEAFTFEGVKTIFDAREELFLNENTVIFHGYRSQLGSHRDFTLYNCINGHTHKGGVVYRFVRGETLYELNSGLAGDPAAKGLTYTPQKITNWTPGFGAVNFYGPQFISV